MRLIESKELAERIINVRIYELLITVERKAGIPYDNTRTVNLDECSHVNLCDRYIWILYIYKDTGLYEKTDNNCAYGKENGMIFCEICGK